MLGLAVSFTGSSTHSGGLGFANHMAFSNMSEAGICLRGFVRSAKKTTGHARGLRTPKGTTPETSVQRLKVGPGPLGPESCQIGVGMPKGEGGPVR